MLRPTDIPSHFDCAVIGNWHLAYVTAACLAKLGYRTAIVNSDAQAGEDFTSPPVFEPGLPELLAAGRKSDRLAFLDQIQDDWTATYLWLAIDTPVNEKDEVELEPLLEVLQQLRQKLGNKDPILVINSQVPLGFCERVEKEFGFKVVYIPENLRLGQGIETFLKADRTVIGSSHLVLRAEIQTFLSGLETQFFLCDLATAEMIKHATNAFLATSISFSNELARIGEKYGVDSQAVGQALRMDKRIGSKAYVLPGLGFAGGTLSRDLRALQMLGKRSGTRTPLTDAVLNVNESTTEALCDSVTQGVEGSLEGKTVLILGYTYKADTNTLRRSPSVDLAHILRKRGALLWGFDPFMNEADLSGFGTAFRHFRTWEELPFCPEVILMITPRPEFRDLNWSQLMKKGGALKPIVIDVRSELESRELLRHGFSHKSLWQPLLRPEERGTEV